MQTSNAAQRVQANLQELFKAELAPGDPYIKFQLTTESTALMSMVCVEESGIIPAAKITPLPGMPEAVIGMMNSRDRVFCVYDLAQLLNLSDSLVNLRTYQVIVLKTNIENPIYLGLAITQFQGTMRISAEKINYAPDSIDINISPYINGVLIQEATAIPILDLNKIIETITTT